MRKLVVLTVIAGALIGASTAQAHALQHQKFNSIKPEKTRLIVQQAYLNKVIQHDKYTISFWSNYYQGWTPLSPTVTTFVGASDLLWHQRSLVAARKTLAQLAARLAVLSRPPHYYAWLCIHGGEGAWNSNTGNGFYGGLQMDYGFMSTYGLALLRSKGTADNWTPLEQMWVAEKAYASGRGFYPWPNTARVCGLI